MSIRITKVFATLALALTALVGTTAQADSHSLYELRTYYANDGKIEALHDRFRNHTIELFEKHGMKNIAYWSPADQPNTLIYLLAHKSADAAKASWTAFVQDPDWVKVYQASIADGRLVGKIDSVYMTKTDFSP